MKQRGKKIRLIKKPTTLYGKFFDPYNRDKLLVDRNRKMASDVDYNFKLSQENAKKSSFKNSVKGKKQVKKNKK